MMRGLCIYRKDNGKVIRDRYYSLNMLKMLAIIGILFHHYQQFTGYSFRNGLDRLNFFGGVFYYGFLVELFMAVSGFFCAKYIDRIKDGLGFGVYITHKVKRFLPMLFISDVFFVIVMFIYHRVIPYYDYTYWCHFNEGMNFWSFITSVLAINYGGVLKIDTAVNSVTWNISVLMICYVLFYIIVYISNRLSINANYVFITMVLVGIAGHQYEVSWPFLDLNTQRGYMSFFGGVLLRAYVSSREYFRFGFISRIIALVVFLAGALTSEFRVQYELFAIIVWPLLITLFIDPVVEERFKNRKLWDYIGSIEFEVYIWHPIVAAIGFILFYMTGYNILQRDFVHMVLYGVVCILAGILGTSCIEKPIEKWIEKKMSSDTSCVATKKV